MLLLGQLRILMTSAHLEEDPEENPSLSLCSPSLFVSRPRSAHAPVGSSTEKPNYEPLAAAEHLSPLLVFSPLFLRFLLLFLLKGFDCLRRVACVHAERRKKFPPGLKRSGCPSVLGFFLSLLAVRATGFVGSDLVGAARRMLPQVLTVACALCCCFGSASVTASLLEAEVSPDAQPEQLTPRGGRQGHRDG